MMNQTTPDMDINFVSKLAEGIDALRQAVLEIGQHVQQIESEFHPLKERYEILEGTCSKFLDEWEKRAIAKLRMDGIGELKSRYAENKDYGDLVGKMHDAAGLSEYGYGDGWEYIYDLLDEAKREAEAAKAEAHGAEGAPAEFEEGKFLDGVFGSVKEKMKKIAEMVKTELPQAEAVKVDAAIPAEKIEESEVPGMTPESVKAEREANVKYAKQAAKKE